MTQPLTSPLTVLPGVGTVRAGAYRKMGIETVEQLLYHFPRAYENRGDMVTLATAPEGEKCAVILTVATEPKSTMIRRGMTLLKFRAYDDSGTVEITYFNQDYLKNAFPLGATFRFYGKVERFAGGRVKQLPCRLPSPSLGRTRSRCRRCIPCIRYPRGFRRRWWRRTWRPRCR